MGPVRGFHIKIVLHVVFVFLVIPNHAFTQQWWWLTTDALPFIGGTYGTYQWGDWHSGIDIAGSTDGGHNFGAHQYRDPCQSAECPCQHQFRQSGRHAVGVHATSGFGSTVKMKK